MRHPARYTVTSGLAGLYTPNDNSGPIEFTHRSELVAYIRQEMDYHEFPASLFREIGVRELWKFIARHGSSSAHFSVQHGDYEIAFHGLTEEEFKQEEEEAID